jgi:hypothetical protein
MCEPLMSLCGVCTRRFCHTCAQLWHPKEDLSYCPCCWEVYVIKPPESVSDFKQSFEYTYLKKFCGIMVSTNKNFDGKTTKKIRIRRRV